MSNNSLTIALTHAIAFLTSPLIPHHSPKTIDILHASLESNLTALFAPTWSTSTTSTPSSSRVLNLAPGRLPPAAVWRAGTKAGIQWSEWITALGGFEFDLFVDPGVVAFRIGAWGGVHVIWQEEATSIATVSGGGRSATIGSGMRMKKTLAQTIVDDEENAIFSMIDDERAEPTWLTPILDKFPRIPPPPSFASQHLPLSSSSSSTSSFYHTTSNNNNNNSSFVFPPIPFPISRPSSRSSSTSSANSLFSFSDCDSLSSVSSRSSFEYNNSNNQFAEKQQQQQRTTTTRSRRQHRPKLSTEIFIDPSKKEVTNYDGGKTTVLTGGVMLGGGPAPVKTTNNNNVNNANVNGNSTNWRRTRW